MGTSREPEPKPSTQGLGRPPRWGWRLSPLTSMAQADPGRSPVSHSSTHGGSRGAPKAPGQEDPDPLAAARPAKISFWARLDPLALSPPPAGWSLTGCLAEPAPLKLAATLPETAFLEVGCCLSLGLNPKRNDQVLFLGSAALGSSEVVWPFCFFSGETNFFPKSRHKVMRVPRTVFQTLLVVVFACFVV